MRSTNLVFRSTIALGAVSLFVVPLVAASCSAEADRRDDPDVSIAIGNTISIDTSSDPSRLAVEDRSRPDLSDEDRAQALAERYAKRIQANPFGHLSGRILDVNEAPIAGVVVTIGGRSTRTDALGNYDIAGVPRGNYAVSFEHPDYVLTQHPVFVEQGAEPWLTGYMLPRAHVRHFDVDKGATLQEGPLTLEFEPQDLAFEDGSPVHGQVDIVMTTIDPHQKNHILASPAPLEGVALNGDQVGLISFGMLEVEISQGGRRIQVRRTQTVRSTMKIERHVSAHVGDVIPMWHHDTAIGLWVQEPGTVAHVEKTERGLVAVTELPHFSAWNYDDVSGGVCAQIRLPYSSFGQNSLGTASVRVISTDEAGNVDSSGLGWSFTSQCQSDSSSATKGGAVACFTNLPSEGHGANVYFKIQAQMPGGTMWNDLDLPLKLLQNGASATSQVVWKGSDIQAWLAAYGKGDGNWCGTNRPRIGSASTGWDVLSGNILLGTFPSPAPKDTVRFDLPVTTTFTMGANAPGDVQFMKMRTNAMAAGASSNDVDGDGVVDANDNCVNRYNPSQADTNGNRIGDTCEAWCYVSPSDPDASWYDADGDGIDDLCDNFWADSNPSQYAIK